MSDQDKIERLADILDADAAEMTLATELDSLNWDSMAMLGVIALARTNGKAVTGAQVRGFKTVGDVLAAAF